MKEKKLIIGLTAIIAIIILIAVVFKMTGDKEQQQTSAPTTAAQTTTSAVAAANDDETNFWDNVEIFEGDGDVVIIDAEEPETETDEKGEAVTDKDGEVVTKKAEDGGINVEESGDSDGETISEEYPGQADGWSPIVSPDDLKN